MIASDSVRSSIILRGLHRLRCVTDVCRDVRLARARLSTSNGDELSELGKSSTFAKSAGVGPAANSKRSVLCNSE